MFFRSVISDEDGGNPANSAIKYSAMRERPYQRRG
jgi:hypothetical protein